MPASQAVKPSVTRPLPLEPSKCRADRLRAERSLAADQSRSKPCPSMNRPESFDSTIHETIQKTTRASHAEPMTIQRNEPGSVEKEQGSHLKIPRSVRRTRISVFPQQASNLLTSMRRHTRFSPSPDHSRMALSQISTRQQSLRLLSVCLQNFPG